MEKKKDFNLTLAPLWNTKNGAGFISIEIKDEQFDAIQQVRKGGKLLVKFAPQAATENSPNAYLEYLTPEKIKSFREWADKNKTTPASKGKDVEVL